MCPRFRFRPRSDDKAHNDADMALVEARANLKRVVDRTPEVAEVSAASKEFRRRNHFANDLQTLFEGGGRL